MPEPGTPEFGPPEPGGTVRVVFRKGTEVSRRGGIGGGVTAPRALPPSEPPPSPELAKFPSSRLFARVGARSTPVSVAG